MEHGTPPEKDGGNELNENQVAALEMYLGTFVSHKEGKKEAPGQIEEASSANMLLETIQMYTESLPTDKPFRLKGESLELVIENTPLGGSSTYDEKRLSLGKVNITQLATENAPYQYIEYEVFFSGRADMQVEVFTEYWQGAEIDATNTYRAGFQEILTLQELLGRVVRE